MRVGGLKAAKILDKWVGGRLANVSLGETHDFANVYMISCSVGGWRTQILGETHDFANHNNRNNGCHPPNFSILFREIRVIPIFAPSKNE